MRLNVVVGCFFPGNVTDKCKILTFSLQKNQWLNFDSSSIQLIQLWLKWRSAWFDSDPTHIPDFHGRLNSDSTHLSQSRVKFDSRLMSRAQPWSWPTNWGLEHHKPVRGTTGLAGAMGGAFQEKLVGQNGPSTGCSTMLRYKNQETECRNVYKCNSFAWLRWDTTVLEPENHQISQKLVW